MADIIISIISSDQEITNGVGIPTKVFLETNIVCVIYYTTDGSTPTSSSSVYINGIVIPPGSLAFQLKCFGTNGFNTSLITEFIFSAESSMAFFGDGLTSQPADPASLDYYPFGDNHPFPTVQWYNNTNGTVYDDTSTSTFYQGYDYEGNPNNLSNKPLEAGSYELVFNLHDSTQIFSLFDIGRKPDLYDFSNSNIDFEIVEPKQLISNDFESGFDSRAQVVYQDCSNITPTTPLTLNTQTFTYVNVFEARYAAKVLGVGAYENQAPTMNFQNWFYNPTTNRITFVYCDTMNKKWIFSSVVADETNSSPKCLTDFSPEFAPGTSRYVYPSGYSVGSLLFPRRKLG